MSSYGDGYQDGVQDAIDTIKDKFFGGPTKDMIVRWLEDVMYAGPDDAA